MRAWCLFLLLVGAPAALLASEPAVTPQHVRYHFDIAFPFVVENTTFPAGVYRVRTDPDDPSHMRFETEDGRIHVELAFEPEPLQGIDRTELVFNRSGGENFLSELWIPEAGGGRRLQKGRRELSYADEHPFRHSVKGRKEE